MKKLLSLLSVLTITGTAMPNVIAASNYKKEKTTKYNYSNINYQQTKNLKSLIRHKRNNDEFKNSFNTNNKIGEIIKNGALWGKNHVCYFIKLTPVFWKELTDLYKNNNKNNFSNKAENLIKNELKPKYSFSSLNGCDVAGLICSYTLILDNNLNWKELCEMIYENWSNINSNWENSSKRNCVKILFDFKVKQKDTIMNVFSIMHNMDSSLDPEDIDDVFPPARKEFIYYISSSVEYSDCNEDENIYCCNNYEDNIKINNLIFDFTDFNKDSIDLGIIDDENDETILTSLQNKYTKLKISELEIINKTQYSNLSKSSSAQIKFKINGKSNYPKITLKPKLLFISKIKIKELSDKIENNELFRKWKSNFDCWKNEKERQIKEDLSKYGNDGLGQAFKRTWKGNLLIEIKDKLFSLNHLLITIENNFKINELSNIINKEIKDLKNKIDNLDEIINKVQKEIYNIKNPNTSFYKKTLSDFKTLANKNGEALKNIYINLPIIRDFAINIEAIFNIMKATKSIIWNNNDILANDTIKTEKPIKDIFNNLDDKNRKFDYSFKDKFNDDINSLLNNINNQYDVPADNSCLFWSLATAYLLQVRNNSEEFEARFIKLFDTENIKNLKHIKKLLQQFNLNNINLNQLWYQDQIANNLVRTVFRNRVVDYIQSNLNRVTNRGSELTFRDLIQENNEIDINYLNRMRDINSWGGTPEILAMSNLLNVNISVNNNSSYQPINQNSSNTINVFHVNGNHYNFSLENQNITGTDAKNQPASNTSNNNNKGGGQLQSGGVNKFILLPLNQHKLKNDENLEINLIKNNNKINKIISKYNSFSKKEKQQKLNEINKHYQNLSENDKKVFKDKLKIIGTSAIGIGVGAVGTKINVSSSVATVNAANAEAIEMTPLLSEESTLTATETITVAGETAVEGGIIVGEASTSAAFAPETLGLSLIIGGLAIAGTAIIWWINSDHTTVKHESHNQYNEIEKYYKFLTHDQLKLDISINKWNKIKQIYQENVNNYQEFKNKIKSEITNFYKEDHSGWGGSINNGDINTLINIVYNHFKEINTHFTNNPNHGWKIVTNTVGSYFIFEKE